jgi:hypothetical protein
MLLAQKLARVKSWLGRPSVRINSLWSALAWLGNLGMGLSLFMFLARHTHFEYHSFQDIVATSAFVLYPEQQDGWLYVIFIVTVPTVALVSYYIWSRLCLLLEGMHGSSERRDFVFITLTYVFWWIDPVAYLVVHHAGTMPIYVIGLLFVLSNVLFIAHRGLDNWAQSEPSKAPPDFTVWTAVLVIGGMIGISFIVSPFSDALARFPFWAVIVTAIGMLIIWLAVSYWLSRVLQQTWVAVAEKLAIALIPLSALPLQSLLWLDVYQEGIQVSESISGWAVGILIAGVIVGCAAIVWIELRTTLPEWRIRSDFWRWFFCLTVPILLYVMAYDPNINYPLDLFHEGERVAPAQAILAGQIPYRDVVFVHGFLQDPGIALVAFRLFGTSIASLRILEQLLVPFALVATYYLALVCSSGGWASLYALLTLCGFWPIFYDWRIVPTIAAMICLVLYIRRKRLLWVAGAGLFTLLALATSFDVGLVSLFAGSVLLLVHSLRERRSRMVAPLVAYFLPIALGGAVALIYFVRLNALEAFLNWHWEILSVYRDWNGVPYPITWSGFFEARDAILAPLASVLGIVFLLRAVLRRQWNWIHWVSLLLLMGNLTLFNRGIVSGSADGSDLNQGSHFAPLLLIALCVPYLQRVGRQSDLMIISAAVFCLIILLPIPTQYTSDWSLFAGVNRLPTKNRVVVPSNWVQSGIDRVGQLYIPADQARSITEVIDFLKSTDSFWDFTDHGAFFFLSDHLSPTRFYATHHVITGQNQREVIADLERNKPSYILYRSHTGWDAIAGVDRNLRDFLVAEYLLRHYKPAGQVGGFDLLERGDPQSFPAGVPFRVDLGDVPFLWGQDRLSVLSAPGSSMIAQWNSASGNLAEWRATHDISVYEIRPPGLFVRTAGLDAQLQNLDLVVDPRSVTYLVVRMTVQKRFEKSLSAQVFWRSGMESFTEERSMVFSFIPDGREHAYLVRLASFPGWMWSDTITGIRLDPGTLPGIDMTIDSIQLLNVRE